jgi:hypothetical protein
MAAVRQDFRAQNCRNWEARSVRILEALCFFELVLISFARLRGRVAGCFGVQNFQPSNSVRYYGQHESSPLKLGDLLVVICARFWVSLSVERSRTETIPWF